MKRGVYRAGRAPSILCVLQGRFAAPSRTFMRVRFLT
jgi:hypothetical protein